MPNRLIRESCRTSPTLDALSDGAERMFWRLTTVADDFGRFDADPRVLLANCFPLRVTRLSLAQITKWWIELIDADIAKPYKHHDKYYGYFVTWEKHQARRARHSKFPDPATCEQMLADTSRFLRGIEDRGSRNRGIEESPREALRLASPTLNSSNGNGHLPTFQIPHEVTQALDKAPILGGVPRLREALWWQAEVRANPGVVFAHEVLKAEAYLVSNPKRPRKDLARYLHNWLGRADRE